jgi:hypothetical protein
MIYECKVYCHTSALDLSDIGVEDEGKWMPFAFDITLVDAVKLSSDDSEKLSYNCTSIFLHNGDSYVIDTKYKDFLKIWKKSSTITFLDEEDDDDDLNL